MLHARKKYTYSISKVLYTLSQYLPILSFLVYVNKYLILTLYKQRIFCKYIDSITSVPILCSTNCTLLLTVKTLRKQVKMPWIFSLLKTSRRHTTNIFPHSRMLGKSVFSTVKQYLISTGVKFHVNIKRMYYSKTTSTEVEVLDISYCKHIFDICFLCVLNFLTFI